MFNRRADSQKTCSVHDYKENTEIWENFKYYQISWVLLSPLFNVSECMEGLFRAQYLLSNRFKNHYTPTIISSFQYAYYWGPPHTKNKQKLYKLLIFGKVDQFHIVLKCHTTQTDSIHSHKPQPAEVETSPNPQKTLLHSSFKLIPFEAFKKFLFAKNKSSLLAFGGGLLVTVRNLEVRTRGKRKGKGKWEGKRKVLKFYCCNTVKLSQFSIKETFVQETQYSHEDLGPPVALFR